LAMICLSRSILRMCGALRLQAVETRPVTRLRRRGHLARQAGNIFVHRENFVGGHVDTATIFFRPDYRLSSFYGRARRNFRAFLQKCENFSRRFGRARFACLPVVPGFCIPARLSAVCRISRPLFRPLP
jgi:hypothetical protein